MNTNHLMLNELLEKYHPISRGLISVYENRLIKEILCIEEMDILQLRNLRDFTVIKLGHSEKMEDWDRMSAITHVIDTQIYKLGGKI